MAFALREQPMGAAPWQHLKRLLDACFPRPPRDVFERVVAASHRRQRLWIALGDSGELLGMVMLTPHSKGGHLEPGRGTPGAWQERGAGPGATPAVRYCCPGAGDGESYHPQPPVL
jgi:hypothetical protein